MRASPVSSMNHLSLVDTKGKYQRIDKDKCGSLWFSSFMTGLKIRMGSTSKPNRGMSNKLILLMIGQVEEKIVESQSTEDRNSWIVFAAYAVISYVRSLRGNEGMLLNLEGLRKHWNTDRKEHFIVIL